MPSRPRSLGQPETVPERAQEGARQVGETVGEGARQVGETAQEVVGQIPAYVATLARVGVVVLLALVGTILVRRVIRRIEKRTGADRLDVSTAVQLKRTQTLGQVMRTSASFTIWTVAILVAMGQAGINIGPLLAAAGIGGLALGFGAQSLVRDVIAGFFILLEDQFHVGDVVSIAGVAGAVEKISLRTTVLRDLEARRHVVPNGEIRVSTNFTKEFSRYMIPLPVPYDADIDEVVDLVRDVADDLRRDPAFAGDILGPLEVLGVDDYGESQIVVKVYIDTVPGKQWPAGRELRRRIKMAYDRAGISIPFPHRELIIREPSGTDKTGADNGSQSQPSRAPRTGKKP